MIDLGKHDSLIKRFLSDIAVLKTVSSKLKHKNSEVLLRHIISKGWLISEPMQYKGISKVTDFEISVISDALKSDLNGSLDCISGKYNIAPSIQLYFRTKKHNVEYVEVTGNSNIGAHFACSTNTNKHISEKFVSEEELIETLSEALAEIKGIGIKEALQILEPPSSVQTKETLGLHDKVLIIDKDNENQNLFRFEYCWPAFVGRDEEMLRLRKFVNYKNENLLWWSITGNGGTGKSRLALELCRELEEQAWYAGFLTNTNGPEVWRKWEPQRPTLIVVDYNYEKAKEFGEYIGNKYKESKQWNHPVRILFLERNEESEALTEFCKPHPELFENNIYYNEITVDKENKSLKLKGLGDEFIDSIIAGVFERYSGKHFSTDEVKTIKSFLREKKHGNRPLYTMLIADACARGEDVQGWDTTKLHKSVLEHNKNIWKSAGIDETDGLDKKHINLLILATMTNGVDICSIKYNSCLDETHKRLKALDVLPIEHEFQDEKYKILCDCEAGGLGFLTPDILGEYFVLQEWSENRADVCRMKLLTKIAWQYKPWRMTDFITRAAMDFPTDEKLDGIIELAKADDGHHFERAALLSNLTTMYSISGKFDKVVKYCNCLGDLWNSGYQKDGDISFLLSNAIALVLNYIEDKGSKEFAKYFDRLECLWNCGYQKNLEISVRLTCAVFDLVCYYGQVGEFEKTVKHFDCLESIWNSGHQKNREISIKLAVAVNLVLGYGKPMEPNRVVRFYNCLEKLWNSYQKDGEISVILAGTTAMMISYCVSAKKVEKAVKCYSHIENLWNSGYQKNSEISAILANAAMVCSRMFDKKGGTGLSKQYKKKFMELYDSFSDNEKMIEVYNCFF